MRDDLETVTQRLLDTARAAGADTADALAIAGTSVNVDMRGGALELAERSESTDIGLRVFVGQRQATVSASDLSDRTMQEMAERAVAMAREAPEDPYAGLADPEQLSAARDTSALELADPAPEPDPAEMEAEARAAEAAALAHSGITQVERASSGYGKRRVWIAGTNGFSAGYARTDRGISCIAITGEGTGMERDYDSDVRVFAEDLRSPEEIGALAAERTLARAGARRAKTGACPVLFDERIARSLISHLLSAANGAAVARGASWLREALGEDVLPAGISLTEAPHRPRTAASRLFDAEGLPTAQREIVRDGVLQSYTLDLANARKLGMQSTASASRGVSSPPSPGITNVALTQGDKSRDALMAEMGTGLLVTGLIGSTINPNTGDYSRGASGLWIENGAPAYPVNEITIAGNLRDMLRSIVPANDAREWTSWVVPSLLVEGMTLAGD